MDRMALARERRREQVVEALTSEQEREAALRWQLAEVALDADGAAIDAAAYAHLDTDDTARVRSILGDEPEDEPVEDDDWFGGGSLAADDEGESVNAEAEFEEEIRRLQGEIEESQRRQEALARFIAAIDAPAEPPV